MRRRAVVVGAAGVLSVGGAYRYYRRANPPTPGPVTDVAVDSREPDSRGDIRPEQPPRVRFSREESLVTVEGRLYVEEDHVAKVESIEYDPRADQISVAVDTYRPLATHLEWQTDRLDAYDRLEYVVEVTVESLPSSVSAVEVGAYGRPRSTTAEP